MRLTVVPKNAVERGAGAEIGELGHHALVPQQRLRRHDDEGFAEVAMHLAAQDVEVASRRRAVGDL